MAGRDQNKETCRESQEYEFEALTSIFGDAVEDLRDLQAVANAALRNPNKWYPMNFRIRLYPTQSETNHCQIDLKVTCQKNYPKAPPKLLLENPKNLSRALVVELTQRINKQAYDLKGEVSIFEITTTIENFLAEYNNPPCGSFYDQMQKEREQRNQDQMNQQKQKQDKVRQALEDEMLKRKEQLKKERKYRRTMSESSPLHLSTTSQDLDNTNRSFSTTFETCEEHKKSEVLYFPTVGRKIQLGSCLEHSEKGCITYSGIDLQTGQLCLISEWTVKNSQLEENGNNIDDVIDNIEKDVFHLSSLRHKNIVSYECVSCIKQKDLLVIYLVQEFVQGTTIFSISVTLGLCLEGVSTLAKGILEALIFLHNNGVSHANLLNTTVLIDNSGTIRVTDFSLVPYLQELCCTNTNTSSDLPALGILIESLIPSPPPELRDFVSKCKSERTLTTTDLLDHPFLNSLPIMEHSNTPDQKFLLPKPPQADRPQSSITAKTSHFTPVISDRSRIQTEFEIINFIGKGAYGDVLKVRNMLDNREYAIKRIPMSPKNKQLYKKMTREVELLSRLNHENVVRYFNSWIETSEVMKSTKEDDDSDSEKWSKSIKQSRSRLTPNATNNNLDDSDSDDSSSDWINFAPGLNDDESDGIEFVNSQGLPVTYEEDEEESDEEQTKRQKNGTVLMETQYMYIQMEFCEKSTLRTAIDNNLYLDKERLWKLFREICEGLSHIHQQGMIHRDLKPVNIFLDSKDHVKIGDFGLATTSILALQTKEGTKEQKNMSYGESLTGQVGTALYVAPELSGNASKATYNQKVDLYSLGIILFEMCTPPLTTGMERIKTILAIRSKEIELPDYMLKDDKYKNEVQVLKWLLNHSPNQRPTSEELLQSDLVPSAKMEVKELQETLSHIVANPQSRAYKHLISRCLTQESGIICELTYHLAMVPISAPFENAKTKIALILRRHGGIDVTTPLLTPYSKRNTSDNAVRLMTHSGSVVTLPYDLRKPFLRHIALNNINFVRRYTIGRVYREKKIFNFHPKQLYECAFDIVTPTQGSFLVDAEIIATAHEIVNEFQVLKDRDITFRLNHQNLVRAILQYCSVLPDKYRAMMSAINEFIERKVNKTQFQQMTSSMFPASANKASTLTELILVETTIDNWDGTSLKNLLKVKGDIGSLAKNAYKELKTVITLSKNMGVHIPIVICAGLTMMTYDYSKPGGIMWQLKGVLKPDKNSKSTLLACGGRFDNIIEDYQKSALSNGMTIVNHEKHSVGFSFAMDKLVFALQQSGDLSSKSSIDVLVFVSGEIPPINEATSLMRAFWQSGIRCSYIDGSDFDEELAKELGAHHIVLLGEGGLLRVKTWHHDTFSERSVTRPEIIDYMKRHLGNGNEGIPQECVYNVARNNSITTMSNKVQISGALPLIEIEFVICEKITGNKKKRLENQVEQKLSGVLEKFSKKEHLTIFAVELTCAEIKALISCIDPMPTDQAGGDNNQSDLDYILERFPKRKRYIQQVYDEVIDTISEKKANNIVGLFSINESYYRLIL